MDRIKIKSVADLHETVSELGFLPFFRNEVEGFSVEERIDPKFWFPDCGDGIWEWKGPAIRSGLIYGKLFQKKAGFVSPAWFPDLANYRRDGYDFDSRVDEGIAPHHDTKIMTHLAKHPSCLSTELRAIDPKGFETVITRLQMQTYVTVEDFVYKTDKNGNPYGWGVALFTAPEALYGEDACRSAYHRDPRESWERIIGHLSATFPQKDLIHFLK